jgi:hypothetical protein
LRPPCGYGSNGWRSGHGLERRLGRISAVGARELLDHPNAKANRESSDQDH